jgi:hypothetical protein
VWGRQITAWATADAIKYCWSLKKITDWLYCVLTVYEKQLFVYLWLCKCEGFVCLCICEGDCVYVRVFVYMWGCLCICESVCVFVYMWVCLQMCESTEISCTEKCHNIYYYISMKCAEVTKMFTCFQALHQCFAKKKGMVS